MLATKTPRTKMMRLGQEPDLRVSGLVMHLRSLGSSPRSRCLKLRLADAGSKLPETRGT